MNHLTHKIIIETFGDNEVKAATLYINSLDQMLEGEYFNIKYCDAKTLETTTFKEYILSQLNTPNKSKWQK